VFTDIEEIEILRAAKMRVLEAHSRVIAMLLLLLLLQLLLVVFLTLLFSLVSVP